MQWVNLIRQWISSHEEEPKFDSPDTPPIERDENPQLLDYLIKIVPRWFK